MRDFLRFIGRLLRDGYLIASVIFDVLYFGASWIASTTDRFRIPRVPSSGYFVLFLVGVIIGAYRNELRFRAELEAVQARAKSSDQTAPDLLMDFRTFETRVKPKEEREGYDLKLPRLERVPQFTAEGWEPVYWQDEEGRRRRVIIGNKSAISLAPIRKKVR